MNVFDQHDQVNHPRLETPTFQELIDAAISRRQLLVGSGAGLLAFLAGESTAKSPQMSKTPVGPVIGFKPIAANSLDTVTLPEGYQWQTLISWGDAILPGGTPFDKQTRGTAASQSLAMGDNNDGMSFFSLGKDRGVMVVNNEYANYEYLFASGKCQSLEDTRKAQAAHGISVFEVRRVAGKWKLQAQAKLNRRLTANSEMRLRGPAAGSSLLKTAIDPTGTSVLGTLNNCANGQTPWGTYLTCEENFNGYFGSTDTLADNAAFKRYGIAAKGAGYNWYPFDGRFDLSKNPNEPNRFGWVVEIDPMDPTSTPIKRTALGRFKHENAEVVVNADGHVVVYMGDDEKGEHIYKFVAKQKLDSKNLANNRHLLDDGILYVARFNAAEGQSAGEGEWLELTHGKNGLTAQAGFQDQAEVLVFARLAALLAGLPVEVPGGTLNRLCGSGLDAVGTAARAIKAGEAGLMIAGGVESMSRAPFVMPKAESAFSRNNAVYDTTIGWRFVNKLMKAQYGVDSMPETAENMAVDYKIEREAQDRMALRSQRNALAAIQAGHFAREICPVTIPQKKGDALVVSQDEHPRDTSLEALAKLKGVVHADGSVGR